MECDGCTAECQIAFPACKRPPAINRQALGADGYRPGAPSEEAAEMDSAVVEEDPCSECGSAMQYEAWHKPGSYIAIAVCTKCGHEYEF